MNQFISAAKSLCGIIEVPGDKSISHRALMLGAIAEGDTQIRGLSRGGDVLSTKKCLEQLGIRFSASDDLVVVHGRGRNSFIKPKERLDCRNSGTSMRLLMAMIAGQKIEATLIGDESLTGRPMKRIAEPLRMMGAEIKLSQGEFAPVEILKSSEVRSIEYELKIASAQLKSALILMALYADGFTKLTGLIHSRDHTERMLEDFGVHLKCTPNEIQIEGGQKLKATHLRIPGDPSSAAFWMAAASLVPNSQIEIKNVSLNPTRTGFMQVLKRMGASIEVISQQKTNEASGDIRVRSAKLHAVEIHEREVASMIDEIPLLAIVATQATGKTIIRGAKELRVKESDRIEAVAINLKRMKVHVETFDDGFLIEGPQKLSAAQIDSHLDHRIAMGFSIAALVAQGETEICGTESVGISYPEFYTVLNQLRDHPI